MIFFKQPILPRKAAEFVIRAKQPQRNALNKPQRAGPLYLRQSSARRFMQQYGSMLRQNMIYHKPPKRAAQRAELGGPLRTSSLK